jgi:hypothetical protein
MDVVSSEYATVAAEQTALENLTRWWRAHRHQSGRQAAREAMKATQRDFASMAPRAAQSMRCSFFAAR